MREVVLYSREGCCLCDQARATLLRARASHRFALEERDIDSDQSLLRAYLERIPVVTIDGKEVFELFVDRAELGELLAAGGAGGDAAGGASGRAPDSHSAGGSPGFAPRRTRSGFPQPPLVE